MTHGTMTAYVHHRCRCVSCVDVERSYRAKRRREAEAPGDHHGRVANYHRGCRCSTCRAAKAAQDAARYDPERQREWARQTTNGLGPGEFERHAEAQGHRCAICRTHRDDRKLVVDHDHTTGAFRGLLCRACNTSLGQFGDDAEGVERALYYLTKEKT